MADLAKDGSARVATVKEWEIWNCMTHWCRVINLQQLNNNRLKMEMLKVVIQKSKRLRNLKLHLLVEMSWPILWQRCRKQMLELMKMAKGKRWIYIGSISSTLCRPCTLSRIIWQWYLRSELGTNLSTFLNLGSPTRKRKYWSLIWTRPSSTVSMILKLRTQMSSLRSTSQVRRPSVLASICVPT